MKRYGLIGYPLEHSFSKKYFSDKFRKEGIDASFENFSLENLEGIRLLMEQESINGFAITIPHKKNILPHLDEYSAAVRDMNACNCVSIRNNKWYGYNTDIAGFEQSFRPLLKPEHKQALILGTGGAAAAVQYVLQKLAIPFKLVSRRPGVGILGYSELNSHLMDAYKIVINCTPVGTFPHVEEAPAIPYTLVTPHHYLYDLIYNPSETLFLKYGRERGATVKNGYEMLALQAEENWRIWNA